MSLTQNPNIPWTETHMENATITLKDEDGKDEGNIASINIA